MRLSNPLKLIVTLFLSTVLAILVLGIVYRGYIDLSGGPVFHAAVDNDTAQVIALLDRGCDPDQSSDLERHRRPLMFAATHGNVAMVRALIAHGANVNARDDHGICVLDWMGSASSPRDKQILAILKQAGAHR